MLATSPDALSLAFATMWWVISIPSHPYVARNVLGSMVEPPCDLKVIRSVTGGVIRWFRLGSSTVIVGALG